MFHTIHYIMKIVKLMISCRYTMYMDICHRLMLKPIC